MAAKLTLLRTDPMTFGTVRRIVFYWYVISPKIQDAASPPNNIAPQNRNQLPPTTVNGGSPLPYLTAADLDALDAGDNGYEIIEQIHTAGETLNAFRTRLLADHAARQTAWVQSKRDQYAASGTTAN